MQRLARLSNPRASPWLRLLRATLQLISPNLAMHHNVSNPTFRYLNVYISHSSGDLETPEFVLTASTIDRPISQVPKMSQPSAFAPSPHTTNIQHPEQNLSLHPQYPRPTESPQTPNFLSSTQEPLRQPMYAQVPESIARKNAPKSKRHCRPQDICCICFELLNPFS